MLRQPSGIQDGQAPGASRIFERFALPASPDVHNYTYTSIDMAYRDFMLKIYQLFNIMVRLYKTEIRHLVNSYIRVRPV